MGTPGFPPDTQFYLLSLAISVGWLDSLQVAHKKVLEPSLDVGARIARAMAAVADYRAALHILSPRSASWSPPVSAYSALTGDGISKLWETILDHRERMRSSGELAARRREQQVKWMWAMLEERMFLRLRSDPGLKTKLPKLEAAVADGRMSAAVAVEEIAAALRI
jgi:LAO/AO transport system kinase